MASKSSVKLFETQAWFGRIDDNRENSDIGDVRSLAKVTQNVYLKTARNLNLRNAKERARRAVIEIK